MGIEVSHFLTSVKSKLWVGFSGMLVVKNPPTNAEDLRGMGSVPGSGRSPGGGHGNTLWYSCLENPRDRVHRVAELDMTKVT